MKEYYTVSVEGIAYEFNNYEEAKYEYESLKNCGYHEAVLKVYSPSFSKPLMYNDKAHCFLTM